MMIAPNSHACKEQKKRDEVNGSMEEFEGRRRGMFSQQYVAPCVKGVEWGMDTTGLRMLAAFGPASCISSA